MTATDLEAGFKSQVRYLQKNTLAMISYNLFLHSKPLGTMIREILGLVTTYFVSTTYFVLPTYFVVKLPYFVLLGRLISF